MPAKILRPLLALAIALAPALAHASTMIALSTERLFARADVVAVVDIRAVKAEQTGRAYVSQVDARVSQVIKGAALGTDLKILTPGGVIGRFTQRTEGAAEFTQGETCVVFLEKGAGGVFRVVGLEQGKLVIEPGTDGKFQVRRTSTARMVERSPTGLIDVPALPATEPMDSYLATLRRLSGAK